MSGYMRHIFWLAVRPFVRPFSRMRKASVKEREAELQRYKREQDAAIQELKIELLLAARQGARERYRHHTSGEAT